MDVRGVEAGLEHMDIDAASEHMLRFMDSSLTLWHSASSRSA